MNLLIEAQQLGIDYGKVRALHALDLSAAPGRVLAVLGPNGAGKTTLVRCVATLVKPTRGRLRVLGHDVSEHPDEVRRDIGLAVQYAAVEATLTGRENLEMTARLFGHGRSVSRQVAESVIAQLALEEIADRRCSTYSGGQRRRLDLGASLVGAPRLLLLDEPTTGLDPTSRREVWRAVRTLVATGTAVLLTTHYLEEADELADHIVVIDHGRTVASGTPAELKAGVGRDVIELAVSQETHLAPATDLLQQITGADPKIDQNGRRVSAACMDGPRQLASVLDGIAATALPWRRSACAGRPWTRYSKPSHPRPTNGAQHDRPRRSPPGSPRRSLHGHQPGRHPGPA